MQVANGLLPVSVAVLQPESNSSLPTENMPSESDMSTAECSSKIAACS